MLNEDKQALLNGTARIRCKLIVKATDTLPEIILTEQNSVKDWIYNDERYVPQQGFIGQFVARTLEGNLQNISDDFNIENRELELQLGIVRNTTETWYSMGNFIVTDPEDNEVKDNTKFQAMDYTKLFNKRFDGDFTNSVYTASYNKLIETGSVTALWLAKYACAQVGVDFPQTSFTNSAFTINQNPFQAGESCRDVLKEISKLAYSWVRIGQDNKCYIDFNQVSDSSVDIHNVINKDTYYTLETKKTIYGPINNVVVGMSGVDGESHSIKDQASINQYGEHTLYIYDNPLTNTFELRELAQQQANKLFGLNYVHLEVETVGHPWLQGNERINVLDMEDENNFTYPFNKSLKYAGHIRSVINTMGESEVESTLAYESGFVKNIRNASLNVDKQNGKIEALIEDIEENNGIVTKKINTLQLDLNGTTSRVTTVEKSVTDLEGDIDKKLGLISEDIDGVQINLDEFIDNEYAQGISNLQKQIDGAIQFWNGPEIPTLLNKPAVDWKTENDRINHQADIYTVIEDVAGELKQGKSYRFDKVDGKWVWIELTDNELSAVQALAQEALDKAKQNEGDVVTLKSDVSELKQTDDKITASVDSIENTLVPTADVSGSNIVLNDSTDASLLKFKIEGKSTQETRSGKNFLKNDYFDVVSALNANATYDPTIHRVTYKANITGATNIGFYIGAYRDNLGNNTFSVKVRANKTLKMQVGIEPSATYQTVGTTWTTITTTYNIINSSYWLAYVMYIDTNATPIEAGDYFEFKDFMQESGSVATEYEPYGVMPSPEFPSEIKSVGYTNLFKTITPDYTAHEAWVGHGDYKATISDNKIVLPNRFNAMAWQYDDLKVGESYTFSFMAVPTADISIGIGVNIYKNYTEPNSTSITYPIKTNGTMCYFTFVAGEKNRIAINSGSTDSVSTTISNIQLVEGIKKHSYIPHGKYGIEVETTGVNKFDYNNYTYVNTILSTYIFIQIKDLKPNTTYSFYNYNVDGVSTDSNDYGAIYLTRYPDYNSGVIGSGATMIRNGNNKYSSVTFTTGNSGECYLGIYCPSGWNQGKWDKAIAYFETAMFIEGTKQLAYIPYQKNITTVIMNEPLRRLTNGVKDVGYIENGKFYIDRYTVSRTLDGSENWGVSTYGPHTFYIELNDTINIHARGYCSHFKSIPVAQFEKQDGVYDVWTSRLFVSHLQSNSVSEFKQWLSNNHVELVYEPYTPTTEDYGDINIPITYKNITNIATTDNLEPNMNITYVREGSMTDYIAGQFTEKDIIQSRKFSELSVKADSISAAVTSVEGDLANTNSKVNSLETQITSQEATIKIVETHINKDDGTMAANEVTTSNGFTFNSEGLNIYVGENSYNTQINNIGTFYRDGDEIIGQTSKDGSILKNLKMQGQTQYSFDGDSYDFIEERVEVDGEYCYATFYNGEE